MRVNFVGISQGQTLTTIASNCDRAPVSLPLASGTVFKMDQTKSAYIIVLLVFRKRSKNPNLDCHGSLYSGCHHQERINASSRFELRYYRISNVALFKIKALKSAAYVQ